jgi:hypothetical protein
LKEDDTMAHQSTTEPREGPKVQGPRTKEKQRDIINKRERTDASDVPSPGETIRLAQKRYPAPGPAANDMSDGDRSIQRGKNDERDYHKRRVDDDQ